MLIPILFCFGAFIYLDFARFFAEDGIYGPASFSSLFLKGGVVLFTTLLVFFIGSDGLSIRDTRRLRLMAVLVVVADLTMILGKTAVGILMFAAVQSVLMQRNSKYFRRGFRWANGKRRILLLVSGLVLLVSTLLLQIFVFYPLLQGRALQWVIIGYALFVSASTWFAVANYILRLFPRPNSAMVAVGMLCFLVCDFNVGLLLALPAGFGRMLVESLIWIFYTPALTLLALSGYAYSEEDPPGFQ